MHTRQAQHERGGTLDFAAPEIHRGLLTDTSDQYSLAVTYYYLRTGEFPFRFTPATFTRAYSYSRPAPDLRRATTGERRILEQALDMEPTRRFPNCSAFVAQLSKVIAHPEPEPGAKSGAYAVVGTGSPG